MDIHKPKPWHSFREFAKEIGTIVIGVLIALGAEQAVEWLHTQHEVAEAREALKDEMTRDVTSMKFNVEQTPCLQARLDRVSAWIEGGPPPIWDPGSLSALNASAWEEARTSAVPHMPLKARIAYDRFYAGLADRLDINRNKRAALAALVRYSSSAQLPPEARRQALEAVVSAKIQTNSLAATDRELVAMARDLGVKPEAFRPASVAALAKLCARAPALAAAGGQDATRRSASPRS